MHCTRCLVALLTTVIVEGKIRGTWYFRWPLKRTLRSELLLVWAALMWLQCAVSYLSASTEEVHVFAMCTVSRWWMGHTANKQYLQPSVRCGMHVDGVVQQRGIYFEAWEQHVIVGTPMELLEEATYHPGIFFLFFFTWRRLKCKERFCSLLTFFANLF